ncbi:unnamed protein product [Amoebophrya sp. A25]|nr:unnamed protein product [Amoebophrya sp. A25]|eukprot:GSA25T00013559001.1
MLTAFEWFRLPAIRHFITKAAGVNMKSSSGIGGVGGDSGSRMGMLRSSYCATYALRSLVHIFALLTASSTRYHLLGASAQASEKKVSVRESFFDSPIEKLEWVGANNEVTLALTKNGRLHRSGDGGIAWEDITPQIAALDTERGRASAADLTFDTYVVHPTSKTYVLAVGSTRSHFVSADSGRTWRKLRHRSTIHAFTFHQTRGNWALLTSWTESCKDKSVAGPCVHNLFITKDLGVTFNLVTSYVVQFAWGEQESSQDRIFFSHFNQKSGNQPKLLAWSSGVDFCSTDDFGKSYTTRVSGGNKFGLFPNYIFVAKLDNAATQSVALLVSTDGGEQWGHARIGEPLEEKSYTILDTSENAVVIHVNHGHVNDVEIGHIYVSDQSGLRYIKSLSANIRSADGTCDFDHVGGVDGVYMANQLETDNQHETSEGEDAEESTNIAGGTAGRGRKAGKSESRIRTVISFDKGGSWSRITPPDFDSLGQRITCQTAECSLHLHGPTTLVSASNFVPFYSMPSAAGIILGTGNIGQYLRTEDANTYISIDGGLTWIEAHKRPYIYEIGDHGGLLVMAPSTKKAREVIFSWNEGTSWFEFELSRTRMEVDNIVTEPDSVSTSFLVHGTRGTSGIVYHLDFGSLGMPTCAHPESAGSVSSDYYKWTPSDGRTRKCLLGREQTIIRRKPTAECFNGEKFERPVFERNCECRPINYQCEMGFTRPVLNDLGSQSDPLPCVLDNADLATPENCDVGRMVWVTAYRKTPGDTCEAGWQPEQVQIACPAGRSSWASSPFLRLAVIGLVLYFFRWSRDAVTVICRQLYYKIRRTMEADNRVGFENIKYGQINSMDASPENALESVGDRWDAGNDEDFLNDEGFQQNAPALMQYLQDESPIKMISGGLETAAESIPRLGAPSTSRERNSPHKISLTAGLEDFEPSEKSSFDDLL